MGTNASKKFASKIVAILLAALMLVSVLPMTAFAAEDDNVLNPAQIVVDGLTIYDEREVEQKIYKDGAKFTFDGLSIEVTYRSVSQIEAMGADKAPRAKVTIDGYDKTLWTQYGIGSNYAEDQVLDLQDNLIPLEFTFGANSSQVLKTDLYIAVVPSEWTSAEKVEYFVTSGSDVAPGVEMDEADGIYLMVADGDTIVLHDTDIKDHVDTQLSQESLTALEGIVAKNGVIVDVIAQLEKLGLDTDEKKDQARWEIADATVELDGDNYVLNFVGVDDDYIDTAIFELNTQIREGAWPLGAGENGSENEWTMTDDGKVYITATVKNGSYFDVVTGAEVDKTEAVKFYIAVDEAGYAYLTKTEADAASIELYRIDTAEIDDIEIAKNPTKMTYIEGEGFDPAGMVVNLIANDTVVVCVPAELFEVYGIRTYPSEGQPLYIKDDNDHAVWVYFYGFMEAPEAEEDAEATTKAMNQRVLSDETDVKLSVVSADKSDYTLVEGELVDGTYAIVWIPEVGEDDNGKSKDKLEDKTGYEGLALTTGLLEGNKSSWESVITGIDASSYDLSTLEAAPAYIFDKAISACMSDSISWEVKYNADARAYTIQDAETGKYLSRNTLTYKDLWIFEFNNTDDEAAAEMTAIIDTAKTIALTAECTADSYWLIDGSYDAAIESKAAANTNDNFYLITTMVEGFAPVLAADLSSADDMGQDNFYFFKTDDVKITGIEIIDQPAATYASGAALDLHDMVVLVTYSNGRTAEVPYDDFASYGITTNYADGAVLAGADNGKNITATVNGITATGIALTVTDSKADVATVRMGGADRYATAAIIAESYVAALGENYKNVAVLTSGTNYPDALAGGTLAYALNAPIVLTKADALVAATKTFLTENAVKTVYVIGGEAAVSAAVRAELKAMGISLVEIEGADRVETSVAVAKELAKVKGYSDTIILTNGANFADALSVSSAAAIKGIPVVYVNGGVSASVKAFIDEAKATKAIILGGEAAVSADAEAAVKALGLSVERVAGADRYATGVAIAEYFADCYTGKAVAFATGKDFPDALAGSVFAAKTGAPVVLLDNGYANAAAAEYAADLDLTNVYVFGGTDALSDATVNATLLK